MSDIDQLKAEIESLKAELCATQVFAAFAGHFQVASYKNMTRDAITRGLVDPAEQTEAFRAALSRLCAMTDALESTDMARR